MLTMEKSVLQFSNCGHQMLKSHKNYLFEKLDNNQQTCHQVIIILGAYLFEML